MQPSDFAFANDIRAAVELRTPRTSRLILVSALALILCAITWAHFAILDEVKRGDGRVIASRQTQIVQSLEGGIVLDILVREGDIVTQGEPLMRIDDTKFLSELGEIRERRAANTARVARLEAEVQGKPQPVFPAELKAAAPQVVATEQSVFEAHVRKLSQDIDVYAQQEKRLTETFQLLTRE